MFCILLYWELVVASRHDYLADLGDRVTIAARFKMNTFCASVNFDAFSSSTSPRQEITAENSTSKRSNYSGAKQPV